MKPGLKPFFFISAALTAFIILFPDTKCFCAKSDQLIYHPGKLKPVNSKLKVKVGDLAPDFMLPSISGEKIRLSQYRGKKNVVLSFVPAAWTPVCSQQWPDFNRGQEIFQKKDTVLLGLSVGSIPTLFAWTNQMGKLWFPVLSDFWPHGAVAREYGIFRPEGFSERAILIIDKKGIIRHIDVHDINERPLLVTIVIELGKLD